LFGSLFCVFQYFNRRGKRKSLVLLKSILWSGGITFVALLIGILAIVDFSGPKEQTKTADDKLNLPPHLELSLVFPIPEQFPPDKAPLTKPVTELYLWRNLGGPIYHAEVHTIDEVVATAGSCGQGDLKSRSIPLLNSPAHYGTPITDSMTEMPFYVSPSVD